MQEINLSTSQEDYLEAIYHIVQDKLVARSKDLVERLAVNSSSVTQALRILGDKNLILVVAWEIGSGVELHSKWGYVWPEFLCRR